jgi:hypothetical protein
MLLDGGFSGMNQHIRQIRPGRPRRLHTAKFNIPIVTVREALARTTA